MPTTKKRAAKKRDIHDLLKIHIESWGRLLELIQLCVKQRDAGDLKIARKTFEQAEHLPPTVQAARWFTRWWRAVGSETPEFDETYKGISLAVRPFNSRSSAQMNSLQKFTR